MRFGKYLWRGRQLALGTVVACAAMGATASAALAQAPDYTANVTPGSVAPGSQAFTVALKSESSSNPLNAARITPPTGFAITAASLAQPSGNATVTMQNGQVVVKGLSLKNNQSASVAVTATVPSSCGQSSWTVQAFKSSLNGPQLTLDTAPGKSSLTTTVTSSTCPVAVKFANEPSSAYVGQTISSVPFDPAGAAVTVDLLDANNHIATGFSAPVTIALRNNPGGSTLSGTLTVQATNGVATFTNLSLNKPASGYTLQATSPGLTSDTSSAFGINNQTTQCPGGDCGTTTLNSPPGSPTPSSITVTTTPQAGATGTLTLSVDQGTKPVCNTLANGTYQGIDTNWYGVQYTPTDPGNIFVAKTIRYTVFNTSNSVLGVHLCFAAPYPFELLDNSTFAPPPAPPPGILPDGSPGYVGLLVDCMNATIPGPCQTIAAVADPNVHSGFDTVATISIPAGLTGDPWPRM